MKLIVAVVRTNVLDRLIVAFEDIEGFPGVSVIDTEGFGQRVKSPSDVLNPLRPNKRIEIAANDEMVDTIVQAIKYSAHTGRKGDGIILVMPIENAVYI